MLGAYRALTLASIDTRTDLALTIKQLTLGWLSLYVGDIPALREERQVQRKFIQLKLLSCVRVISIPRSAEVDN